MNRKLVLLPLMTLAISGVVGCGKQEVVRPADTLYVCVYDGDYGVGWLQKAAQEYEEKTGYKVIWEADTEILTRLEGELSDSPKYDLIMSHDITWMTYAAKGYLAPLDDLYNSNVEVAPGVTKKFSDRLSDEAKRVSKFRNHYYKVNYTQGVGGLLYNMDMFEANHWEVPTTYDELVALCETIYNAQISAGGGDKVVPFAWSSTEYYWDYIVFEWWAQLAGLDEIDFYNAMMGDNGKYATGYDVYNPTTHHKEFVEAYGMWHDLVAKNTKYSNTTPQSTQLNTARSLFASGKAAMIPYSHWAKYAIEKEDTLDFDIAIMKTPRANSSVTVDYNYNVGYGDSMIIPNKIPAASKAAAKEFIKYLSTYDACKSFTKESKGAFFAFDYSDVDLGDLLNDTFIKSVNDKLTQTTNFNLVSINPVAVVNSASIMPWIGNTYYYTKAFADPSNSAYSAATVGQTIYNTARSSWSDWVKKANVKD